MSSILTNQSSMVALQTLRGISKDLAKTQDMISTGKRIATAKDNAAIWSISKVMESDVKGFKAITDSLNLGMSTVAVARNASESVKEMLTEVKTRIVAAQEENVDRNKLQDELSSLREQIVSIVDSAQFNGLNLLKNTQFEDGSGQTSILSSLNREESGAVTASEIQVNKADLGQGDATVGTTAGQVDAGLDLGAGTIAAGETGELTAFTEGMVEAGAAFVVTADVSAASAEVSYVARDGDTVADVSRELAMRLNYANTAAENTSYSFSVSSSGQLQVTNNSGVDYTADEEADIYATAATDVNSVGGGLELLDDFDISTETGAAAALTAIDDLIDTAISAAADFGTVERRIEIQSEFTSRLMDSLEAGIGDLVDTDMEAASAKLQALQVQQQLGVQALSIANQAPQTILSLFQ